MKLPFGPFIVSVRMDTLMASTVAEMVWVSPVRVFGLGGGDAAMPAPRPRSRQW